MEPRQKVGQIVFTNKARCRDCYRCVRVCPVKAIRMSGGQAFVDADRCIACGTCIRECPQGAKSFRRDLDRVVRLLESGAKVAASVAPSFAGVLPPWQASRLPSILRRLGFCHVAETAIGAYHVACKTAEAAAQRPGAPCVCTACPAVVNFVERYHPEWVRMLAPVVSPMIAHARRIKAKLGSDVKVVFIGPCVAKKAEAERPELAGDVDAVITFEELAEWLEGQGLSLAACEESRFDEEAAGLARLFPLEGGLIRTAEMPSQLLAPRVVCVSGFDEVVDALAFAHQDRQAVVIEPLMCPQGCINGPAVASEQRLYHRREDLIDYAAANPGPPDQPRTEGLDTAFAGRPVDEHEPIDEDQIRAVMEKTGKAHEEDQLNCGACGYASCREKAIAVIRGLAEPEMCIPYMKRLAEQRTDRIIETTPNGIVILDERLNIVSMNPAFRKFFLCSASFCGKNISYLMDPELFEKLVSGQEERVEMVVRHEKYKLICHQILYALREEKKFIGIFVNITNSRLSQDRLEQFQADTVSQARELLEHQIGMAQRIAAFLGESTARGQQLVDNLMRLGGQPPETTTEKSGRWPWDIHTSK